MAHVYSIPITSTVTAGTEIDLSTWITKPILKIVDAKIFTGSDATNAADWTDLTLVDDGYETTTTPSAGEIALSDEQGVTLGSNTTDRDILVITVTFKDEVFKPS